MLSVAGLRNEVYPATTHKYATSKLGVWPGQSEHCRWKVWLPVRSWRYSYAPAVDDGRVPAVLDLITSSPTPELRLKVLPSETSA